MRACVRVWSVQVMGMVTSNLAHVLDIACVCSYFCLLFVLSCYIVGCFCCCLCNAVPKVSRFRSSPWP